MVVEKRGISLRFAPLLPSKEAGFMPPHVERVLENGLVFDPDDLLVNKNAALPHRLLNFNLSLRRVPHVDRCIVLTNGQSLSQIGLVERAQGLALGFACVPTLPILVLAV